MNSKENDRVNLNKDDIDASDNKDRSCLYHMNCLMLEENKIEIASQV